MRLLFGAFVMLCLEMIVTANAAPVAPIDSQVGARTGTLLAQLTIEEKVELICRLRSPSFPMSTACAQARSCQYNG